MKEFKESEHSRDKDGKFTDKNSTSKSQQLKTALQVFANKKSINQITEEINKSPEKANKIIMDAIVSGRINMKIREQKQKEHIEGTLEYQKALEKGKEPSILTEDANKLVKLYAGKGKMLYIKGKWTQSERFKHNENIGFYVNKRKGIKYNTQHGRIHYSNKGTHVVPDGKDRK